MNSRGLFDDDAFSTPEPEIAAVPAMTSARSTTDHAPLPATQSLYRKYRPQSFSEDDLVGQEHIVRTLRNAIKLDRIAHAYLFCGPRGTGKTTTARLVAKAVNCQHPDPEARPCNACAHCLTINAGSSTDIIEIDAASNRGIDDIRDLRERVKYAPTELQYKFYIVDEAHQITGAAANAFLKTLEEPPPHTKFILATTDPEELLPTIVSRCQRFDFRRIGSTPMAARLRTVADLEQIAIEEEALEEIARHATGSLRDALGLLDQLALHAGDGDASAVSSEDVRALLGISRNDRVKLLLIALAESDPAAALTVVNDAVAAGEDPRQLNRQLVAAMRDMLHDRAAGRPGRDGELTQRFSVGRLASLLRQFSEVDYRIRHSPYAHLPLEIALVEAMVEPVAAAPVQPAAPAQPAAPEPYREPAESAPATSRLRDRVRRDPTIEQTAPLTSVAPATVVSPPPPEPSPASDHHPRATERPTVSGEITIAMIADLWDRVRQDVKAVNRRAEALLASADPGAMRGNMVVIVTPYPFHRDKINTDEVRTLVASVLSRLLGQEVQVTAEVRGESGSGASAPPAPRASEATAGTPPAARTETAGGDPEPQPDRSAQRLQSAQNIFDADVIDSDE